MKNFLLLLLLCVGITSYGQSIYNKTEIKELMDRLNSYRLSHRDEPDKNWVTGTYYTGVMACWQATGDSAYLAQCDSLGSAWKWGIPNDKINSAGGGGNLLTCGQTWLESYMAQPDAQKIAPIIAHLENPALNSPSGRPLDWYWEGGRRYVDGLFTGPPALAMLYHITKDEKYLHWLDAFFWDVYGQLFDTKENLFYRDERFYYERMKTPAGRKIIWSRGNGWAIAGLVRVLKYLPRDNALYPAYEQVLRNMARALKRCQSAEGFWYGNLADSSQFNNKETSGTAFITYALTWGVNNGILSPDDYLPVIERAWRSLYSSVNTDGMPEWGQRVGDRPVAVKQSDSHEYVTGLFLLAASEVYKLQGAFAGVEPDFPLFDEKIKAFLKTAASRKKNAASGLSRNDYLDVIASQCKAISKYQNAEGRIIDPVKKDEMYYSTPCYAHSVAALVAAGYPVDKELIESGMRAMDIVTDDMAKNKSAYNHADFYTWPVMLAFRLYEGVASSERLTKWRNNLRIIDAKKFYLRTTIPKNSLWTDGSNWNICNVAGEFLRWREGMASLAYIDTCLRSQLGNCTQYGMYIDSKRSAPTAYDLFPRHYLSGMLKMGYRGALYPQYRDILLRGAWASLFLQSPFGEIPAGFRSAHHIWNEAEQCVVFEIFADEYAMRGETVKAEAFKRAARLSLQSVKSWLRPDGSGYIVKNKYPIEAQHGYEGYSVHTCYNMLATSMLAQAWHFANESVREGAAPADIGGYVVELPKPFHKIIASAAGAYVEYEMAGELEYNPTGIIRVHLVGSHPQLGPSDGCATKYSGKGVAVAVGPSWQTEGASTGSVNDGAWRSLASFSPAADKGDVNPAVTVIEETPARCKFKVTYMVDNVGVAETITVEKGKVTVEDEFEGNVSKARITFPLLTTNGAEETDVKLSNNALTATLEGKSLRFNAPSGTTLTRTGLKYGHRNGMVEVVAFETTAKKAKYSIQSK